MAGDHYRTGRLKQSKRVTPLAKELSTLALQLNDSLAQLCLAMNGNENPATLRRHAYDALRGLVQRLRNVDPENLPALLVADA